MNPQIPSSAQDPLAQLQDIHLPDAIGLWPPAWGWWLLLVVIIVALGSIIYFLRRHKSRNAYRALALAELHAIQTQYSVEKNSEYLQAISILLRRVALSGFGAEFNASLKGGDWLLWLDAQSKKASADFSEGVGRALLIGPYQKNPEFDRIALHKLGEKWIQEHRNQWQKKSNTTTKKNTAAATKNSEATPNV